MEITMDFHLIIIMAVSLAVVLPAVGYFVHVIDQKDKVKINSGAAIFVRKSKKNTLYSTYIYLSKFFLTSGYMDKISRKYEVLCPGDFSMVAKKTMEAAITSWVLCLTELIIIYLMKPNLHNGVLAVILVFVINNEVINYQVRNAEVKLLEELAVFISDVRHNYHINRMVDDAILLSMDGLGHEMKVHAKKLYEVIISNNIKEDVIRYNAAVHNKYLKMFLALCISVIEFNDKKVNGQLLFTLNLQHLKREINIEVLKLKKLKHVFSGTVFVAIAVCLPIDAIQSFGISLVPELQSFYMGEGGTLYVGLILLSAVMVYLLISNLKESKRLVPKSYRYLEKLEKIRFLKKALDNYSEKNYGKMLTLKETLKRVGENISPKQLLLKRMIASSITFLLCTLLAVYIHYSNRQNITGQVADIQSVTTVNNTKQLDQIEECILRYIEVYKKEKVNEELILNKLSEEKNYFSAIIKENIAKEIVNRIMQYQSEYFHWYELILCFGISVIAYFIPYWMVLYKKRILHMSMEDEVNQFNSIIYMLMYIDHMTVKDLLEQMELFAYVFKPSLQECINDYNSGDIEALTRMKEKESFGPFRRLVDNLIRCDMIAIDKAFDDIASDRENYHDRRKQENEISIQRRADIAKPLSFVPAVLVTIYLLLPLLAASLKELESFRESLSSMGF
jgi:hypothetical protein